LPFIRAKIDGDKIWEDIAELTNRGIEAVESFDAKEAVDELSVNAQKSFESVKNLIQPAPPQCEQNGDNLEPNIELELQNDSVLVGYYKPQPKGTADGGGLDNDVSGAIHQMSLFVDGVATNVRVHE